MAKITNLFRDKVYTFNKPREVFESEKEIISAIADDLNLKIKNIYFIDANIHNDLFKIECENANFYLKLSLEESTDFEKEYNIFIRNPHNFITPRYLSFGTLETFKNLKFSLAYAIDVENLREYGVGQLLNNPYSIPFLFDQFTLFKTSNIELNTFEDYLKPYLEFNIFNIPEINSSNIEANPIIKNLVKKQVVILQEILKDKLTKINFENSDFCHGNLNQSTILPYGDLLKCINFENSYIGDMLFEILNLKYELFYNERIEDSIINNFHKISNKKLNLFKTKEYREFCCYWNLLKICIDYLKEIFILQSQRQDKILNIAIRFSKNYENFYQLPDFEKNFKPIAELFVESVI